MADEINFKKHFFRLKTIASIILPVYNGDAFLADAIESVLGQSFPHFELIIVNDASTDRSLNIIEDFLAVDKRIKLINNPSNLKLPASLNLGHKIASGDYLTWTSHDNLLKKNFLEVMLKEIKQQNADVVYSDYYIIEEQGQFKRTHKPASISHLLFGNCIGASFLYKKGVFEKLNGYDESLFLVEDYDFWLRAIPEFLFKKIDKNLYSYRLQNKSLTSEIQINNKKKELHIKALSKSFFQIADKHQWKQVTVNLILAKHLNYNYSILDYLNHKKNIKSDILEYYKRQNLRNSTFSGLYLYLREVFKKDKTQQNLKTLVSVLLKDHTILLHKEFSKRETIRLIRKCLF